MSAIKDLILELFPDNNTMEISAADMRIFIHSVFNTKENLIVKATDEADMKSKKSDIFLNSVVIITHAGSESGVYISRSNNPISLLQLDKVADLADGSAIPGTPISDFMVKYIHNKSYLNAEYVYASGNIIQTKLKSQGNNIYVIDYTYSSGNLSQTAIQEIGATVLCTINFAYTNGNITSKTYTLS